MTPDFFRQWSVAELSHQTDHWLGKQGRLTHPMVLRAGSRHYEPVAWDDAFELLLKEAGETGTISLGTFYARRARRLLPAATLVPPQVRKSLALTSSPVASRR